MIIADGEDTPRSPIKTRNDARELTAEERAEEADPPPYQPSASYQPQRGPTPMGQGGIPFPSERQPLVSDGPPGESYQGGYRRSAMRRFWRSLAVALIIYMLLGMFMGSVIDEGRKTGRRRIVSIILKKLYVALKH